MLLGNRVKELRKKRDLTQKQLAEILGVNQSTIGMIETNKRDTSFELITKIADYFNCSIDYLLGRTNNPNTVAWDEDRMPKELKDNGVEKLTIQKELEDAELTIDEIKDIVAVIKMIKEKNK